MFRSTKPTVARTVLDFSFGLVLFFALATLFGASPDGAIARPGAFTLEPHTVISLAHTAWPQANTETTLLSATAGWFDPTMRASMVGHPLASVVAGPSPTLSLALLAMMFASLTAANLALVRHVRHAYRTAPTAPQPASSRLT